MRLKKLLQNSRNRNPNIEKVACKTLFPFNGELHCGSCYDFKF